MDIATQPLADRMRPRTLDEFVGQEHLVGKDMPLRKLIEGNRLSSLILWGPPGTGKTTLAHVIAGMLDAKFIPFSAVTSGIADLRKVITLAESNMRLGSRTIVFIDEIHRWNKSQQDALLPHVEAGTIVLIGATTENPSFEVVSALLSRAAVYRLRELSEDDLRSILRAALTDKDRGLGNSTVKLDEAAENILLAIAAGDARTMLGTLETAVLAKPPKNTITKAFIEDVIGRKAPRYDKSGEDHYNVISAFIKSMRGSDPDAAVYYLARMIDAGEDPKFIARRMVVFASEDIGNADPHAVLVAVAAFEAVNLIGLPECRINLSQAATYLASAPKSNASYRAIEAALSEVRQSGALPVPLHLRNAPTKLMKGEGYGRDYEYAHRKADAVVSHAHLPEKLVDTIYYQPGERGHEAKIKEKLDKLRAKPKKR